MAKKLYVGKRPFSALTTTNWTRASSKKEARPRRKRAEGDAGRRNRNGSRGDRNREYNRWQPF